MGAERCSTLIFAERTLCGASASSLRLPVLLVQGKGVMDGWFDVGMKVLQGNPFHVPVFQLGIG